MKTPSSSSSRVRASGGVLGCEEEVCGAASVLLVFPCCKDVSRAVSEALGAAALIPSGLMTAPASFEAAARVVDMAR